MLPVSLVPGHSSKPALFLKQFSGSSQAFKLFLQVSSSGLETEKQSGKFCAAKMAPGDWGSGVCFSL